MAIDLTKEIATLNSAILVHVTTQSPDTLKEEEKASLNAYLVMCHAIIEEFLEESFRKFFNQHLGRIRGRKDLDINSVHLIFAVRDYLAEGEVSSYSRRSFPTILARAENRFKENLDKNHGIRESNIQAMSRLIGIDWGSLDDALGLKIADLDTLGSKRGKAAHLSPFSQSTTEITQNVYADEVRQWVNDAAEAA
jgi:hypothetical protein